MLQRLHRLLRMPLTALNSASPASWTGLRHDWSGSDSQ